MKNKIDRRHFVKKSGMALGGTAFSLSMLEAKAYSSGAGTIKVGLVGCGGRGTGAITQAMNASKDVKLVAMADAFQDQLEDCYKRISDPEFTDWSSDIPKNYVAQIDVPAEHRFVGFEAYKKVIDLCDVVVIATPPGFRPLHFEYAVNAGKHVFMEKPLAVDAPGVRKVLAAAKIAKQKKLNVVVGLQRHYQTVYRNWMDSIHSGAIGDVITSRVYWNGAGVWVRERKPGQTEMEYQMRNWYYFNWLCGDHINEQHIHNLDVGNWMHQATPIRAHGMGGREVRTGMDHGEIYDHHFIEYEYEDGSRMFSQCRHIPGCMNRVSEAVHGSKGSGAKPGVLTSKDGAKIMDHDSSNDPNPYQVEHDELFAAISKGEYKFEDATNGAHATLTAIIGRMASYSGKIIEWDDALNSSIDLSPAKYSWNANPKVMPDANGKYSIAVPGKTIVV